MTTLRKKFGKKLFWSTSQVYLSTWSSRSIYPLLSQIVTRKECHHVLTWSHGHIEACLGKTSMFHNFGSICYNWDKLRNSSAANKLPNFPFLPHPTKSSEMNECQIIIWVIVGLAVFIFICVILPPLGYTVLGIILAAILVAICYFCWKRKKRNRSPASLLPTSAQQAGDASDIRSAPNANAPTFTWYHRREGSVALQPPPPAVMRGIDNRGSYLGRPVSHPASLLPMYMDGTDGWRNAPLPTVRCQLAIDQTNYWNSDPFHWQGGTSNELSPTGIILSYLSFLF